MIVVRISWCCVCDLLEQSDGGVLMSVDGDDVVLLSDKINGNWLLTIELKFSVSGEERAGGGGRRWGYTGGGVEGTGGTGGGGCMG